MRKQKMYSSSPANNFSSCFYCLTGSSPRLYTFPGVNFFVSDRVRKSIFSTGVRFWHSPQVPMADSSPLHYRLTAFRANVCDPQTPTSTREGTAAARGEPTCTRPGTCGACRLGRRLHPFIDDHRGAIGCVLQRLAGTVGIPLRHLCIGMAKDRLHLIQCPSAFHHEWSVLVRSGLWPKEAVSDSRLESYGLIVRSWVGEERMDDGIPAFGFVIGDSKSARISNEQVLNSYVRFAYRSSPPQWK
jgi:hypothetical protein